MTALRMLVMPFVLYELFTPHNNVENANLALFEYPSSLRRMTALRILVMPFVLSELFTPHNNVENANLALFLT
jgi:uncharacterized membrane protein YjfL (UPF0719 family)